VIIVKARNAECATSSSSSRAPTSGSGHEGEPERACFPRQAGRATSRGRRPVPPREAGPVLRAVGFMTNTRATAGGLKREHAGPVWAGLDRPALQNG
jgi:hypothetical protein